MQPNPLTHINLSIIDEFNVKFTIGKETCSDEAKYCNSPLPANTKFGIIARMFTESGYRDTNPIYIQTNASSMQLVSHQAIVYGSICSLVLVSLMILLCCAWCSKKKKITIKEKEAAEADENLLSFTSYCVIDKKPLPRKNYEN